MNENFKILKDGETPFNYIESADFAEGTLHLPCLEHHKHQLIQREHKQVNKWCVYIYSYMYIHTYHSLKSLIE